MSKQTEVTDRTQRHVINPTNMTLEVKGQHRIEIIIVCETSNPPMVIHPCAKYGKPLSKKKKLRTGHETAQTDRQTELFLYTP